MRRYGKKKIKWKLEVGRPKTEDKILKPKVQKKIFKTRHCGTER